MCTPACRDPETSLISRVGQFLFQPICRDTVLFHYAPLLGAANYGLLSVNVINPNVLACYFPNRDVTNILFLHSFTGLGLHLYSRPHLYCLRNPHKMIYGVYGSLIFNFGSVLIWVILGRFLCSQKPSTSVFVGLGSGLTLGLIGKWYLDHVDSTVPHYSSFTRRQRPIQPMNPRERPALSTSCSSCYFSKI
ncbi:uncharacterized protein [Bemisia tabaci]|uniref:uncharacterized protein isoform X1 n=1 Tax=Bemisia tabaci TaxID=7038 RepID=UPI001945ED96